MEKLNTLNLVVYVEVFKDLLPISQVHRITISNDNRLSLCRKVTAVYDYIHMK